MTEDEARKKWCPFARSGAYVGSGLEFSPVSGCAVNRDGPATSTIDASGTRCIASECMAWRWRPGTNPPLGFCGLAGDGGPRGCFDKPTEPTF